MITASRHWVRFGCLSAFFFASCCCLFFFCFCVLSLPFLPPLSPIVFTPSRYQVHRSGIAANSHLNN